MSKEIKQLIKDAKQAFAEKQFKIAEEKCYVSVCVLHSIDQIKYTKTSVYPTV